MPAKLTPEPPSLPTVYAELMLTLMSGSSNMDEPQISSPSTPEAGTLPQNPIPAEQTDLLWVHPGLPELILGELNTQSFTLTNEEESANAKVHLGPVTADRREETSSLWSYAVVAPFYTLADEISLTDLSSLWQGGAVSNTNYDQILVTPETRAALSTILGSPNSTVVMTLDGEALNAYAISSDPVLAILSFEALSPTWKVLRVNGLSPIDNHFDPTTYPLSVQIWSEGLDGQGWVLPAENVDPGLRTVLVMTGVTALTRATAFQMEMHGNNFPGQDILGWLSDADLTHISNEVPFAENCPYPDPNQPDLIFCSAPERIELLEAVGADIIELSGNHMLDYGVDAMNLTMEMYEARGWQTYAGGWDLGDARSPAMVSHNGNNLAFLGCNPVGPPGAFATGSQPGAAPCGDYGWLVDAIQKAREEGYLPIVTLQYAEDYTAYPSSQMVSDFQRLAEAGAVVVNGSQAHTPKLMAFYGDSFLHYGLGNLFFDQMEVYYNNVYLAGTRDEFIDRLIFYDNQLISIELLAAKLEDYARPRPMTGAEREALLSRIFEAAQSTLDER